MKYIGHPIFGDTLYGGNQIVKGEMFSKYKTFVQNCFETLPRQALHAYSLGFMHPTRKETMYFEAPLAADFQAVLDRWTHYAHYH
jgi:23S rRNA pseudouridine1911/1915/1917 synthase